MAIGSSDRASTLFPLRLPPSAYLFLPPAYLSFPSPLFLSLTCFSLFLIQERPLYDHRWWTFKRRHVPVHWTQTAPVTLDGAWQPPICSDDGAWSTCGSGRGSPASLAVLQPIVKAMMGALKFFSTSPPANFEGYDGCPQILVDLIFKMVSFVCDKSVRIVGTLSHAK